MGMDELCDALNLGLYIGSLAPSGSAPTISSAIVSFLQSGSGLTTPWTVAGKLQELFVSAADSPAGTVTGQIDAAIAAAAGRIVIIPPTMGAGEATTYPVDQPVIDVRAGLVAVGGGAKIVLNFEDAGGYIRFLVIDDQASPTKSANAAGLFNHRPSGTLPDSSTGEGLHAVGATIGTVSNSPTGYVLSGVEGGAQIASTGGTVPDAWGVTANCNTASGSTTNVTRLVSLYAQAPAKSGSGTVTNAYAVIAEDPGSIASSDNYSLWAKGAVRIGPRAAGTTNATLNMDAGDGSGTGTIITFLKNGTPVCDICTESTIIGGTSSDLYLHRRTSGNIKLAVNSAEIAVFATTGVQLIGGVAIPAGGTAGTGIKLSSTSNFGIFFGSGAPSLAAAQGSLYLRSDGSSTSTRAYINTDGSTGWTAITTAT